MERSATGPAPSMAADCRGDLCPMPIYKASKALAKLAPGEVLEVLATDPGALKDFPALARQQGHELLSVREEPPGVYTFHIRRGGA